MNLQFFLEKLNDSMVFKDFVKAHADAFLTSCFFVIDLSGKDKKYHLDYYIPSERRMVAFQLEEGIQMVEVELFDNTIPTKLTGKASLDFKEIEEMIKERMIKEKIGKQLQKILISLQNVNGKDVYICTAFLSGLGLLKVWIEDKEKKVTDFEKKSFIDMLRK